jgi:hypothetical protein
MQTNQLLSHESDHEKLPMLLWENGYLMGMKSGRTLLLLNIPNWWDWKDE